MHICKTHAPREQYGEGRGWGQGLDGSGKEERGMGSSVIVSIIENEKFKLLSIEFMSSGQRLGNSRQ